MTYILTAIVTILAIQTFRAWWYRGAWRKAVDVNRELVNKIEDFACANEILRKENQQFYRFGTAQRFKAENEWPDEIV